MKKILILLTTILIISCSKEKIEPIVTTIDYSEIGNWKYENKGRKESYTLFVTTDSIAEVHIYPNLDSNYLIYGYTKIHADSIYNHMSRTKHLFKAENDSILYYGSIKFSRLR